MTSRIDGIASCEENSLQIYMKLAMIYSPLYHPRPFPDAPSTQSALTTWQSLSLEGLSLQLQERAPHLLEEHPLSHSYSHAEALQAVAKKLDADTLHLWQQWLARQLLDKLEEQLLELPSERRESIKKSLYIYAHRCLYGSSARYPRPQIADQSAWDSSAQKLQKLHFESRWKELTQSLESSSPWPQVQLTGWKSRYIVGKWFLSILVEQSLPLSPWIEEQIGSLTHLLLHPQITLSDQQVVKVWDALTNLSTFHFHRRSDASSHAPTTHNKSACEPVIWQPRESLDKFSEQLQELQLDFCKQVPLDQIQLEAATNLKQLSMQGAKLHDQPMKWSQYSQLRALNLSRSNLTDLDVARMAPCPQIRRLELERCYCLTHFGTEMIAKAWPNLTHLNLTLCPGVYPGVLSQLPKKLHHLNLDWASDLHDEAIEALYARLPQLRSLSLDHCSQLTEQSAEIISKMKQLRELNLNFCKKISPDGVDLCLKKLTQLRGLHLKGHILYSDQWPLLQLPHLTRLSLPQIFDPSHLLPLSLPSLRHLDLGPCTYWQPQDFTQLLNLPSFQKLQTLYIENGEGLQDSCLDALTQLQDLEYLRVWGQDSSPQLFIKEFYRLFELKNLRRLELCFSGMCEVTLLKECLKNHPKLQHLELGPLFKLSSTDITYLRKELPWIYITCYQYEGLKAL